MTGLLSGEDDVLVFFQYLHAEPKDLLGAAHLRLSVYCLSEVILSTDSDSNVHNLYAQELHGLRQGLLQVYIILLELQCFALK